VGDIGLTKLLMLREIGDKICGTQWGSGKFQFLFISLYARGHKNKLFLSKIDKAPTSFSDF